MVINKLNKKCANKGSKNTIGKTLEVVIVIKLKITIENKTGGLKWEL